MSGRSSAAVTVTVAGGGLAGCEAALALAARGWRVRVVEMRPARTTPVHRGGDLAELVCSNSLGSTAPSRAPGALKAEMEALGSPLLSLARAHAIPAGHSLAVDRGAFARAVTAAVESHPRIEVAREEIVDLPAPPAVVATGPVTSDAFAAALAARAGGRLYFYDAAAPIVSAASLDLARGFFGSRYGEGGETDYFNVPFTREEYDRLVDAIASAATAPLAEHDRPLFYESCLPVEEIVRRGRDTLRFGPMKPVGFSRQSPFPPYAILQLRRENAAGDAFNLVGFQTRMTWGEQRRVLGLIPGFANAEILRFGVMHRNFYLYSPALLSPDLSLKAEPGVFFAGQMTGVEGYTESMATGLLAALGLDRHLRGLPPVTPDPATMCGALLAHVCTPRRDPAEFQPMNANFGIVDLGPAGTKRERAAARDTFHERSVPRVVELWLG